MTAPHSAPPTGRPPSRLRTAWVSAPVTVALIALNVAVFLAVRLLPGGELGYLLPLTPTGVCALPDGDYVGVAVSACRDRGGSFFPGVAEGGLWQLLTSAFTHLEIAHLGFNMLALWFLGPALEHAFGRLRFTVVYLLSALAGSVAVYWLSDPGQATVGASGAVFGLMGALLICAVRAKGPLQEVLGWLGANLVFTVLGGPQISWQGHLGGFLGGCAVTALLLWARGRRGALGTIVAASVVVLGALVALRTFTLVGA